MSAELICSLQQCAEIFHRQNEQHEEYNLLMELARPCVEDRASSAVVLWPGAGFHLTLGEEVGLSGCCPVVENASYAAIRYPYIEETGSPLPSP